MCALGNIALALVLLAAEGLTKVQRLGASGARVRLRE